jgi:cytochrome bd-type quinol oxidase subunit 2
LRSTIAPEYSLTAAQAATSPHGLKVALIWWPIALVLAFSYLRFIARQFRGKVRPSEDTQGFY